MSIVHHLSIGKREMSIELPPDEPETLEEYLWYCREYEEDIYFRARRGDLWENVSMADLSPREYGEKLARLLMQDRLPVRIKRDYEIGES